MYLALFFGTILATTDADLRGLNEDDAALASLLSSFNDMNLEYPPLMFPEPEDGDGFAELTCKILETFDSLGRGEYRVARGPLAWDHICADFEPWDEFLCPKAESMAEICSAKKPLENPAVKKNWCIPNYYGVIEDAERLDDCIKFCTHFVSAARGDCCGSGIAIDCGSGS
jgi:hypothetical protein